MKFKIQGLTPIPVACKLGGHVPVGAGRVQR